MSKTCLSLQVPSVGEVVLSCPDAGVQRAAVPSAGYLRLRF